MRAVYPTAEDADTLAPAFAKAPAVSPKHFAAPPRLDKRDIPVKPKASIRLPGVPKNRMTAFVQWIASTSGSIALHESLYMYPLVESVHVLTLCVFVGLAAILDLRLMGVTLRRIPVSEVARRLLPWMGVGFTIMVITGAMLFYAIPVRSYHSVWFRTKLILLVIAGLNAWLFHAGIWRSVWDWDLDPVPPAAARIAGTASLVLWAGIIVTGRMIAYNWFDCDKPQPAAIVWAAGCDSYPK